MKDSINKIFDIINAKNKTINVNKKILLKLNIVSLLNQKILYIYR